MHRSTLRPPDPPVFFRVGKPTSQEKLVNAEINFCTHIWVETSYSIYPFLQLGIMIHTEGLKFAAKFICNTISTPFDFILSLDFYCKNKRQILLSLASNHFLVVLVPNVNMQIKAKRAKSKINFPQRRRESPFVNITQYKKPQTEVFHMSNIYPEK